jgi:hypothetical protein
VVSADFWKEYAGLDLLWINCVKLGNNIARLKIGTRQSGGLMLEAGGTNKPLIFCSFNKAVGFQFFQSPVSGFQ